MLVGCSAQLCGSAAGARGAVGSKPWSSSAAVEGTTRRPATLRSHDDRLLLQELVSLLRTILCCQRQAAQLQVPSSRPADIARRPLHPPASPPGTRATTVPGRPCACHRVPVETLRAPGRERGGRRGCSVDEPGLAARRATAPSPQARTDPVRPSQPRQTLRRNYYFKARPGPLLWVSPCVPRSPLPLLPSPSASTADSELCCDAGSISMALAQVPQDSVDRCGGAAGDGRARRRRGDDRASLSLSPAALLRRALLLTVCSCHAAGRHVGPQPEWGGVRLPVPRHERHRPSLYSPRGQGASLPLPPVRALKVARASLKPLRRSPPPKPRRT